MSIISWWLLSKDIASASLAILVILVILYTVQDADARHQGKSTLPCSVRANGYTVPVSFQGEPRNNPDGSYYPADAFYYIMWFSASDTCLGLTVHSLKSHDGFDIEYHNAVLWRFLDIAWHKDEFKRNSYTVKPLEIMREQQHHDKKRHIKNFETVHYYDLASGDLLFSIRDDQDMTKSQRSELYAADRDLGYRTSSTWEWDFETRNSRHGHPKECTEKMYGYPDAVRRGWILTYNNTSTCRIPDTYVDETSKNAFEEAVKSRCSSIAIYSGCVFGKVLIDPVISETKCLYAELDELGIKKKNFPPLDKCINTVHKLEQKLTGYKKVCTPSGTGIIFCRSVPVHKTITFEPVLMPSDLDVILDKVVPPDTDGYDSRNLDGTYYVWDPVAIQHTPAMKWKNYRENTISFEVKNQTALNHENSTLCAGNSCTISITNPRIRTTTYTLGHGDGIAIYNATTDDLLGSHDFHYNITVYNAGIPIDWDVQDTDALIVKYRPQYDAYPYSLLADDQRTSYENRAAVALHYFGSYGGGPDDTNYIHEDRRSKINGYHYAGAGYDPWIPVFFNETLSWSEARSAGILDEHQNIAESRYPDIVASGHPDEIPCDDDAATAMLVRAGYCKIYFEYPILGTVAGPTGPRYENATLFNTLLSNSFAGKNTSYLVHYEYRFPESLFHSHLDIRAVSANGNIADTPIRADIRVSKDARPLPEYIREKTIYDTGDSGLGGITSGDIYPIQYSESGRGDITLKMRRIASEFETYGDGQNRNLAGLDITTLAPLYLANSQYARLDIPMDVGLGALSPITITITAGDTWRDFEYPYADFGRDRHIVINTATENVLDISQNSGSVMITPDESFGSIVKLYADDILLPDAVCGRSCTVIATWENSTSITAENIWGGTAHGTAGGFVPKEPDALPALDYGVLGILCIMLVFSYIAYAVISGRR